MNIASYFNSGIFPILSLRRLERTLRVPRSQLRKLAENPERYYRPYSQRKQRPDGSLKERVIDNPNATLKIVQARIHNHLLQTIVLPSTMIGGVKGCSVLDNAMFHCRQPMVITLDLSNCFPSTSHRRVFKVFRKDLGCSEKVASLLTKLTTFRGYIPQGAPTSTLLSNLCLLSMHVQISEVCKTSGLQFSQYVDDLAISGPDALKQLPNIIKIIFRSGYQLNRDKVRHMNGGQRQEVCGIVVNRRLSRRGPKYDEVRNRILEFDPNSPNAESELSSITGSIVYTKHVNPAQGASLKRLLDKCVH